MIIDGLEVQIQSDATRANQQLDILLNKLTAVASSLSSVNRGGMSGLASGVYNLGNAMKHLKSSATSGDFTRLANNVQKLATVNATGITNLANALTTFSTSATQFNGATASITGLSDAVKTLGYKGVDKAITNIPLLTAELQKMMTTLSTAPAVSQNIIDMTNALAGLAANGAGVRAATSGLMSTAGSGTKVTNGLFSIPNILNGAFTKTQRNVKGLAYTFGKFYASCFLLIRGVKALGKAIETSMDYIETYNYFNVIMDKVGTEFGDAYEQFGYDSAEAYADSFRKRLNELTGKMTGFTVGDTGELSLGGIGGLGLNPETVVNYEASISSITNSLGLMGETSINTAKAMTMLAADMSSLRNVDLETVMTNLQSGLIGQSRALYKYGIDITNNTLQTYAFAQGIDKAVSEMTQAEKMQLRMLAILDQSKVAWGDMANTIDGVANQYRIFKQQLQNLGRVVGNVFLPMVQNALPYVNGFIMALQRMFYWIGNLLGVDWDTLSDGISEGYTDTGLEALADSADEADKSLKKLNKTTRDFDELHLLSKGDAELGDTSDLIDLSDELGKAVSDYESVWNKAIEEMENKASTIADKIYSALFGQEPKELGTYLGNAIGKALGNIQWGSITTNGEGFASGLAGFLNGLITVESLSSVASTIARTLNTLIGTGSTFFENLDASAIGLAIASGINTFFTTFSAENFAEALNTFVDTLTTALATAANNIDWKTVFQSVQTFFSNLEVDTVGLIIGALTIKGVSRIVFSSKFIDACWTKLTSLFGAVSIPNLLLSIKNIKISDANSPLGMVVFGWLVDGIDWAFAKFLPKSKEAWNTFWETLFEDWMGIFTLDFTKSLFQGIVDRFEEASKEESIVKGFFKVGEALLLGIVDGATAIVATPIEFVVNFFNAVWKAFCETFDINSPSKKMMPIGGYIMDGVVIGFKGAFNNFTDAVKKFFTDRVNPWFSKDKWTFDGIKEGLKKGFNNAIDACKTLWNNFASWLNGMLTWKIEPIVVFGKTLFDGTTINLGKLPTFNGYQNGGFPSVADIFYANENGIPELIGTMNGKPAVASGHEITGIIEKIDEVLPYLQALVQKDNRAVVNLNADAKRMFDVTVEQNNKEAKRTGRSPLLV